MFTHNTVEVEETEAEESESENRISGPSSEAPTQADSHRQELDRKAQKSPVRKSMEDDLIRARVSKEKLTDIPRSFCLNLDQHMISFPLTL